MYLQDMPNELTLEVLEALYQTGSKSDFCNALRTCGAWNELGAPLIWTYVAINNDNVLGFLRSAASFREQRLRRVCCLSIHAFPLLKLCPRGDLDPFSPASVAAELLDGLGAKCVQVEFATHGYDEAAIDMTDKNLSRALARLLPRLTHLQLEAGSVWSFLINDLLAGEFKNKLRCFSIDICNTVVTSERPTGVDTSSPMLALEDFSSVPPEQESRILHWLQMQNVAAQGLRTSYEEGRFPHVEMLHLISMQSDLAELDRKANHSNRLDIIARCVHTTPLIMRYPHTTYDFVKDGPWRGKEVEVWARMLHPSRELRCADSNEMELVNEVSWVTTTTGVRLPKPRNYRKFERHMLQWEETAVPGVPFEVFRHKIQAICGDDIADDF